MELKDLIGKTIANAEFMKIPKYDDEGWIKLTFTDGSSCIVEAGYGMYTGNSEDEYPTMIDVLDERDGLVHVEA